MRIKRSDEQWISELARASGTSPEHARKIWDSFKRILCRELAPGGSGQVDVPGFGRFSRQTHKGHPLNLNVGQYSYVEDYPVLKFKADEAFKQEALRTGRLSCK